MNGLPLEGIRVIDLTISWAGPKVTQCLADMGAEVIKVESIQYVDAQRGRNRVHPGMCHYADNEPGQRPWNRYDAANQINRNKLSTTLDLTRPQGTQIFKKLVAIADVVVDSFSPRVMAKFGLDYDALKAIKHDIIAMSMPAFGMSGPYRDYISWGNMLECLVGLASARGYPDSEPFMYHAYSDPICGLTGAFALQLALHHRETTGEGQFIDLAQLEAFTPLSAELIFDYEMNERIHTPMGNRHSYMAPHSVYRCRGDDNWIAISVSSDHEWQGLIEALGRPYWAADVKFSTSLSRWQHQDELNGLIQAWACSQDKYEAMHRLQAAGVPAGALLSEKEQFENPHLKERGIFEKVTHPDAGTHFYPGTTWKLSKTPGHIRLPAPLLGEHNELVLGKLLGLSNEEIATLKANQIIGDEPVDGADS
ncbi:MAG: CoA transferase [Dehalococcoidia bacterium]|nr:CoA transferase [Dehalococcoidia bacterium]